jgi:hypothetical protein
MVGELLLQPHLDEMDRLVIAAARSAAALRAQHTIQQTAPIARAAPRTTHEPGVWCWLLDRLPAGTHRHVSA